MDAERLAALAELLARADAAVAQPGRPARQFDRDELYAEREARRTTTVRDARRGGRERA